MKNIGVFVDRWMSGGIESYLVSNYEHMDLVDLKITILTTRKFTDLYDARLKRMGIEIRELLPEGKDSELTRTIKSLKAFRQILKNERYDVLHLNIYNGVSLVYSKIARECGVERVIAHSHSSNIGQVRLRSVKLFSHFLGKIVYEKFVSDFLACSDLAGDWMVTKKNKGKVIIIKNGIDTAKFRYNSDKRSLFREKYEISKNQLVLGNIGRLNHEKNHLFLLDIALELRRKGIQFTLLVAGEGELRKNIEKKINEYQLTDEIRLIGVITDTPEFYSGIDIFILPSLFEGNPIVGIEAQCSGAKCLFSDTITKQVKIIESSTFLSLDSTSEWVTAIERFVKVNSFREFLYHNVKNKHYDIVDTSINLKKYLTE